MNINVRFKKRNIIYYAIFVRYYVIYIINTKKYN